MHLENVRRETRGGRNIEPTVGWNKALEAPAKLLVTGVQQKQARNWITAIHEAGHVLGERLVGSKIKEATIVPTRRFDGQVTPEIDFQNYRYDREGTIICSLLGHAAELEFGYRSEYGHCCDYAKVEKMLKEDIKGKKSKIWSQRTGMWNKGINHTTEKEYTTTFCKWSTPRGGYYDARGNYVSYRRDWMKAVRVTKSEWKPKFNKYVRKARRVAKKHRAYIEMVARLLTEKSTLTDAEIPLIVPPSREMGTVGVLRRKPATFAKETQESHEGIA